MEIKIRNNRARGLIADVLTKHDVKIVSLATQSCTSEGIFTLWLTAEFDYITADIEKVERVIQRYIAK